MATHCFIPVLGKRLRATELDACGVVTPSTSLEVTTDGFITITLSSEVEEGTEILQRNAAGQLCVNQKQADSFKRFTVEIEFCGVNPSLLSIVSNAEPYEDYAGDVAGFTVPEGEITKKFALELWTGLSGQACLPGEAQDEASGYMLLPFVQAGVLGDITIDGENAVTFSITGAYTIGGNAWLNGPYNVLRNVEGDPAVLPLALDPFDHLLLVDTALAPPPVACSPTAVAPLPPVAATGAIAGNPGTFQPGGATVPANLAAMASLTASPNTAWTTGQHVVLGDASHAYWDGDSWAAGDAP
ncbi:hypothetical protein SEA_FUZZBUSTER_34 [Microbacterium phage FuzzBuster]|uniref:Major tail protein n=1 Tax=Microbacterium phage FuzzBuster TaxID=2590935 RepID=A0A516KV05_9CAUD|nr:hypothetical protein SEA_FUZZBUSTER_34 [Microbacterium phage FuzzBuster]